MACFDGYLMLLLQQYFKDVRSGKPAGGSIGGGAEILLLHPGQPGHSRSPRRPAALPGRCPQRVSLGPSLRSLKNRQAGQWQLRDADGWRDDGEVKVLRGAGLAQFGLGALGPLSFPPVLYLVTEHSDAIYELVAEPFGFRKESWLYSTTDGFWCLSKKDYPTLGSGCSLGTLASLQPHGGSMPHLCEAWQVRSSSGWETSGALLQTNPPESPSVLHVEEGPILFSTPDGWLLQTSNPLDESTLPQLQVTALQRADMLGTYQPASEVAGSFSDDKPIGLLMDHPRSADVLFRG
ncbi:unnamed protein product [Cladocopium goreaui]|uniref:Uncharacterized protein n=1 Tax=Cladocopium goreaui TaxID=2562237 RepID=A0A9P1FN02_9DINO|nr:unnamed protein product [Cladocopium goreaui]